MKGTIKMIQAETLDISLSGPGQVCSINDPGVLGRLTERHLHDPAALIMMLETTQTLGVVFKTFSLFSIITKIAN